MGGGHSQEDKNLPNDVQPKKMQYKRQFSSDAARNQQNTAFNAYRQNTLEMDDKQGAALTAEEKRAANQASSTSTAPSSSSSAAPTVSHAKPSNVQKPDVLDPNKYRPPPSPLVTDSVNEKKENKPNEFVNRQDSLPEEDGDDEEEMTDAEALQIKKNTERALSPGINLLVENAKQGDNDNDKDNDNDSHDHAKDDDQKQSHAPKQETMEVPVDALIKQTSNHDRIASHAEMPKLSDLQPLLWGYCELTRKSQDEDQAAFLTWEHPTDGFVHAWAIFDGHGGYETALYSAQHFLKYVQKYHLTRKNMEIAKWKELMTEIFLKFDEHIGRLNIRGGSTVVVVLLIGTSIVCANAGDARAIMSNQDGKAVELSFDHTPMDDYERLVKIAKKKENYKKIGKFFRINGKHESYADVQKLGAVELKKAPFISREMEKSRLLGTIGVARGFGDYSLTVFGFKSIKLKPYLTAEPYVVIKELNETQILDTDLMCIACDGVFDVMTNQNVIDILRKEIFFRKKKNNKEQKGKDNGTDKDKEKEKEAMYSDTPNLDIATTQIDRACGFLGLRSYAKGTMDDVTIFVVPLRQIFEFHQLNKMQNQ